MPSSRTPDGESQRCLICGSVVFIAPSTFPLSDAPCPACGSLLWLPSPAASRPAEPRFTLPLQSHCPPDDPAQPAPPRADQRPALWRRLAAIDIKLNVKLPRPLGMFACGLLLMTCIELLLWWHSGQAPEFDRRGAVFTHAMMALMIGRIVELFRTDGRHNRWHMLECRAGVGCAALSVLAFAALGLYHSDLTPGRTAFVLAFSLVAGMMVLFLTLGALAISGHALELLLRMRRRAHPRPD